MSRDPADISTLLLPYLFVGNDPLNDLDYIGAISVYDILSLIPGIGTLVNLIVDPPGTRAVDYNIALTYKGCCKDREVEELSCRNNVDGQIGSYLGKYVALTSVHGLIDALAAVFGNAIPAPWRLALILDAMGDLIITGKQAGKIDDVGKEAKKRCDCGPLLKKGQP